MGKLTETERAQLQQTIEMFEVITVSQPADYQSLEILKEAYLKLGQEDKVIDTAKRIADAYVKLGHLSSAILEFESILQRYPDDQEVKKALEIIEKQATGGIVQEEEEEIAGKPEAPTPTDKVDDGRNQMRKVFVDGKLMAESDFNQYWPEPDMSSDITAVSMPFLQTAIDKAGIQSGDAIKLLCERSRCPYIPIGSYDINTNVLSAYPTDICRRWCILPIDQMSKTVIVATTNPFNNQAIRELESANSARFIWYIAHPSELRNTIEKFAR